MGKDKLGSNLLDDLQVDENLITPEDEEPFFQENPVLNSQKSSLPAHIKRSHKIEEDEWNFGILTSHVEKLSLRVGTKERAQQKRNRLYNARTYLKYTERGRLNMPVYEGPLDDWTLCLEERDGTWFVVALNLKLDGGWVEE